jgi:Polymerase beta, Nucleotidyltransferase
VRRELTAGDEYIAELVRAYPCIVQIWLFGSRANGTSTAHSDWDYLVFSSDDRLLNLLSQDLRFNRPQMDLFVVTDGICFTRPWPDKEGFNKKGYLDATAAGWQWKNISETEARYEWLEIPTRHMIGGPMRRNAKRYALTRASASTCLAAQNIRCSGI